MTIELVLAVVVVLVAVISSVHGFTGSRRRSAAIARVVFYSMLLVTMVVLTVGILGIMEII